MREQIKELRAELLALSEECLRKNVQISKLEEIVKVEINLYRLKRKMN